LLLRDLARFLPLPKPLTPFLVDTGVRVRVGGFEMG
jgi:hypothetical protein